VAAASRGRRSDTRSADHLHNIFIRLGMVVGTVLGALCLRFAVARTGRREL
jgi:hypothetical protein